MKEVREIAQTTLNNIRSLSQALHPVLLEEAGLGKHSGLVYSDGGTADWACRCTMKNPERLSRIESAAGVQVYRVVQEALNNVSRHSGVTGSLGTADVRARCAAAGSGRSWQGHCRRRKTNGELGWWPCVNARS